MTNQTDDFATLSDKARAAAPRLRRHAYVAERRREFEALFERKGPPCWPFRHSWVYYGLFAVKRVCRKCGTVRDDNVRFR
jgi:hypothetical protein